LLHVARLRRRAGTPLWRGPNPRRQLALAIAPISLLLIFFLAVTIGRRYASQKLNVETLIRSQLIPVLEKELGKKVEVRVIESDYSSHLVLRDVVIGRDSTSPVGALLQAKTVTVSLDAVSLVLHRDNPLLAITRVVLDAPQLDLRRDTHGVLNVSKLLKRRAKSGAKWRGVIEVVKGRVYYEDKFMRSAHGRALLVDARGVTGFAHFNGNDPITYSATVARSLLGPQRAAIASTSLAGTVAPNGAWFSSDISLPRAPAPLLADYAFRRGEVVAQSGTLSGHIRVMWDRALPRAAQFMVGGRVTLQNVAGYARNVLEPGTRHPLALQNISGGVRFADKTFKAENVALVALGTPLHATGDFTFLPRPLFDLRLTSNTFDSLRLFDVFRKSSEKTNAALAANLKNLKLSTGRASGVVRVTGDPKNWTARGDLKLPATAVSHPRWGAWRTSTFTSRFEAENRSGQFTFKATLAAPDVRGRQARLGVWQATRSITANLQWTNTVAAAPLQVRFSLPSASGTQSQWGAWRGENISGTLRTGTTPNAPLAVTATVEKLAGRHPRWGTGGARGLKATLNLRDISTRHASFALDATAQSALGGNAQWGRFQSATLHAAGHGDNRGAAFSVASRSTRLRSARFGAAQAATLNAAVRWNGPRVVARWNARGVQAQNSQAGRWGAATLIGAADVTSTRSATPVKLDVEARDFSGRQARYGAARGRALRVAASSPDAVHGAWSGVAAAAEVDASDANLAAFSPSLAQQVREVGDITGKVRFSGLSGTSSESTPIIKGRAQLSQVVVQQGSQRVALRNVETNISFGDRQVRLSDLRAQSDYGVLRADVQSNLAKGTLRFSILAPQVVLTAAQINEYLKPAGLHLTGAPRLRLRLSAASSDLAEHAMLLHTQFQVALPQGSVRWTDLALQRPSTPAWGARVQNARVQGDGTLRFGDANHWQFLGKVALDADHAVQENAQNSAPGSLRAAEFHLEAHGALERTPQGATPRLAGAASAEQLFLPLQAARPPLALQNARAEFVATPRAWQVPRFAASSGDDSRITGHADLRAPGGGQPMTVSGQALLEKFDAAHARALLIALQGDKSDSLQIPDVTGTLFARADFSGELQNGAPDNFDVGLQARLYNGAVRWESATREVNALPIDAARLATTLHFPRRAGEAINLEDFAIWSEGGRLAANGVLMPQSDGLLLDISANVHTLRLRRLLALPMLRASLQRISQESDLDGLLSGEFKIAGPAVAPHITGRAALRLAQAYGFEVQEAAGDLAVRPQQTESGARTFYIGLTHIEGRIAGADLSETTSESDSGNTPLPPNFTGEFIADGAANEWHLALNTSQITTSRLLLAAERTGDARTRGWRELPLSGALSAGVDLNGTLRAADGSTQFLPRAGEISVQSGGASGQQLRWKGRDLGVLTARMQLKSGVLQVKQFELAGLPTADSSVPAQRPLFQVAGVLPVSLDAPDLDASLLIENQQLSFVIEVLREIREALAQRGQNVTYLDAILHRIEGLPESIEGRVGLEAHLEQSWHSPVVAVNALHVNDLYFRTPSGTRKSLPNLTASFVYDGNENGAVAIRNAELRLPKVKHDATTAESDEGEGDEDLLIRTLQPGRIVPGGEMSLEVEVLNADLEQLADWVPTLRNAQGRPILRGRLSNFVVQLGGTTGDPQLTGSLLGEDWRFQQYSLDRVRLDKFTIANGQLRIEPGFLTVVKGDFQSAAAWGFLPWSWGDENTQPGPVADRPLEVHFPVGKENFGALAGTFVPAIQNVGAEAFSGEVTLGGTLAEPRLAGEATITNGTFRLRSSLAELDAGVAKLSGTLRFVNGNRLEIGEGGLRGQLVPANSVHAPQTGNAPSAVRQARDERAKQRQGETPGAPRLAGDFLLQGGVTLDLDPRNLLAPRANLAAHRYDLKLAFAGGAYSNSELSGLRDISVAVLWQTGAGDPRRSQQMRWVLSAGSGGEKTTGRVASFAALRLAPNFGESFNALMRSRAEAFFNPEDFHAFDADWSTLPGGGASATALQAVLQKAGGAPGRIELSNFQFSWKNVARGTIDGHLLLDNGASTSPAIPLPFDASPSHTARAFVQPAVQSRGDIARVQNIQNDSESSDAPRAATNAPLRLSGDLTLEKTELYGAPPGSSQGEAYLTEIAGGAPTNPAELWPDAPVFDVRLKLGRDVEFVSSNLTATVTGELIATGTPREPVLLGTVYTRAGQITFPNARARLVSGELNIAARRDPVSGAMRLRVDIDATARGRSGRYDITLRLRGPLDTGEQSTQNLRVDVTSNPPLSSDEAFAQLLGTAVLNRGDLEGEGNEAYARAIVGLLSGPLFSGIEHSLEQVLGLDTIALDYRIDEPIGIEIGKAIGDRLYISYRRALQRSPGQKTPFDLRIEYRIKGDIELGLETNELDERKITIEKRWRF
jgi:hypothetical protein